MEQLADSRENWLFGQDLVRRPKRLAADRCHGRPDFHKPPQESAGWLLASRCCVVLRWGGAGSDLDEKSVACSTATVAQFFYSPLQANLETE